MIVNGNLEMCIINKTLLKKPLILLTNKQYVDLFINNLTKKG